MLEPVRGISKSKEFSIVAVAQAFLGHFGEQECIPFAPEDSRRDVHGAIRKFGAKTEERAVPVDCGSERAWLRPRCPVLDEIFRRECARAAGSEE